MIFFIDFDETMVESLASILRILNKKYNTNFKPNDVHNWNFTDCFPQTNFDEIEQMFCSDEFFDNLEFKPNMESLLAKLVEDNKVYIVTKGKSKNLKKKEEFLLKNGFTSFNLEFIGLSLNDSKGDIDMSDGLLLDDNQKFLRESNAKYKVLYENFPNKEWNSDWDGMRFVPIRRKEYM